MMKIVLGERQVRCFDSLTSSLGLLRTSLRAILDLPLHYNETQQHAACQVLFASSSAVGACFGHLK